MYVFWIYPTEHKIKGDGHIAMIWNEVLPHGNYDFDNIIEVFRQHRDELGVYCSDKDIAEIVNVDGVEAMNAYMDFGRVEFFGTGHWYG